jgi:hypothetical protein
MSAKHYNISQHDREGGVRYVAHPIEQREGGEVYACLLTHVLSMSHPLAHPGKMLSLCLTLEPLRWVAPFSGYESMRREERMV